MFGGKRSYAGGWGWRDHWVLTSARNRDLVVTDQITGGQTAAFPIRGQGQLGAARGKRFVESIDIKESKTGFVAEDGVGCCFLKWQSRLQLTSGTCGIGEDRTCQDESIQAPHTTHPPLFNTKSDVCGERGYDRKGILRKRRASGSTNVVQFTHLPFVTTSGTWGGLSRWSRGRSIRSGRSRHSKATRRTRGRSLGTS